MESSAWEDRGQGICDLDDKVNFYTALYRTMIAPTVFSDVDGSYYGPDKKIHKADGWVNYGTFSLWDTYRAAHPLLTYTEPVRTNDMIKSFLAFMTKTAGFRFGTFGVVRLI